MDKIGTNFNKVNFSFSGINKDSKQMNAQERMEKIAINCQKAIDNLADRNIPENGKFEKFNIAFDVPETNYQGLITVEADRKMPENQRRLSVRIHNKHSDRFFTNYLFKGVKKEIIDYTQTEDFTKSLLSSVNQLVKSADDYYSSL